MASANYDSVILPFTLRYEGGKVDDPRDPGGRTNRGVTQRSFSAFLARAGRASRDVDTLTGAELRDIYRGGYWNTVKGDQLPDGVDLAVFDYGVNSGPARALKAYARRTSNDAVATARTVCAARLSMLHALGTFEVFGRGWTARVAACEALAVKMAEHARIGAPVAAPATPGTAAKLVVTGKAAAALARGHGRKAVGTLAATSAGAAMPSPGGSAIHLPAAALLGLLAVAGTATALLLWRGHVQRMRAEAYAALAHEAVLAPPPVPVAA